MLMAKELLEACAQWARGFETSDGLTSYGSWAMNVLEDLIPSRHWESVDELHAAWARRCRELDSAR